ncbi:hypothetical protein Gohar_020985, partial [Gossypium harknessii]|nr:hypothetical protein [Gossypium harknessii]
MLAESMRGICVSGNAPDEIFCRSIRCVDNLSSWSVGSSGGPWIIRITFILFTIWWGFGEIIRLNYLRRPGRVLNVLDFKWQENVCKFYIVSNLGFAEPCLFLTLMFLLCAPLQNIDTGILSRKWNGKTASCVLLFALPMFVLQLFLILIGPELREDRKELPQYFTRTARSMQNSNDIALCSYPLLNTILLGLFT